MPLAVEFGKVRNTLGFDIDKKRIEDLKKGIDKTKEHTRYEILESKLLSFTSSSEKLNTYNCYIITVPTPINKFNVPNLKPLIKATKEIGKYLKKVI